MQLISDLALKICCNGRTQALFIHSRVDIIVAPLSPVKRYQRHAQPVGIGLHYIVTSDISANSGVCVCDCETKALSATETR